MVASSLYVPCIFTGALLCRALIEHMSDHNVRVFVSLAGPQAGMFGRESALVVIQYYLRYWCHCSAIVVSTV